MAVAGVTAALVAVTALVDAGVAEVNSVAVDVEVAVVEAVVDPTDLQLRLPPPRARAPSSGKEQFNYPMLLNPRKLSNQPASP
jgi:hypothetical protein